MSVADWVLSKFANNEIEILSTQFFPIAQEKIEEFIGK